MAAEENGSEQQLELGRQGCLLSSTPFNIFLEGIMADALEEYDGKVSIGNKICDLSICGCRWHWCSCWRRAGTRGVSLISRRGLHKIYNGDKCWKSNIDKHCQWHPEGDEGLKTEARNSIRWRLKTGGFLKNCTSLCSSDKA